MGSIYPNKFTYLGTFVIQMAQKCMDNRAPTALNQNIWICSDKWASDL